MLSPESLSKAGLDRTRRVVDVLATMTDDELHAPSEREGWSRLTIACHLRYGAEAFHAMTVATADGRPASYYPEGRSQQRPCTLVPRPGESAADVIASLAEQSDALHGVWICTARGSSLRWMERGH